MKYEILPIIDIYDLQDAMVAHYGNDFRTCEIRQIMFGDNYMNDVYKRYSWEDGPVEYTGASWQNEEHIRLENCIISYLADTFPKYKEVLVNVAW